MSNEQHEVEHSARTEAARRHLDQHFGGRTDAARATAGNAEASRINPSPVQPMSPEARSEVERKQWSEPALPEGRREVDPLLKGVTPGPGRMPAPWPSSVRGTEP